MKVADLKNHFTALAEIISSAKGASKDLHEAAHALTPFSNYSMAQFAQFLQLAESTYRETGQLPIAAAPKPSKPRATKAAGVAVEELQAAIKSVRDRLERNEPLTRETVSSELAKYESLPKPALDQVVKELGYQSKPKNKKAALDLIVNRLLAVVITDNRTKI